MSLSNKSTIFPDMACLHFSYMFDDNRKVIFMDSNSDIKSDRLIDSSWTLSTTLLSEDNSCGIFQRNSEKGRLE